MQIVKTNNLISVVAMSNEDPVYPKENAINKQPMQIAKSSSTSSDILISCGSIDTVSFFNVSAEQGILQIVDHNSTVPVESGTTISATNPSTFTASGSVDLSVFSNGDQIAVYGFQNSANNGLFTVSGTPTATSLTIAETSLVTESAGQAVKIVRFNTSDCVVNQTISFSFCKTYTDYFTGQSILIDKYYLQLTDILTDATMRVQITKSTGNPSIGLVFAGIGRSFGVAQYGTSKNIEDNSIYRKSSNGSLNQVIRPVNFNATASVSCSRQEAIGLENLWKYNNSDYKVFVLKPSNEDGFISQLLLYGKIERKPAVTWNRPDRFGYSLNISSIGGYQS